MFFNSKANVNIYDVETDANVFFSTIPQESDKTCFMHSSTFFVSESSYYNLYLIFF